MGINYSSWTSYWSQRTECRSSLITGITRSSCILVGTRCSRTWSGASSSHRGTTPSWTSTAATAPCVGPRRAPTTPRRVTVDGETYDCVILAVDRHSGYIVAVPGKKSKKKGKKDKHGVGLQAKTVANAMIRHWLTIFDVPAVICSDRGSQFVGTSFKTMGKQMRIRYAKTVAYHSRSNGRAEVGGRQMFKKFYQLHIPTGSSVSRG